MVNVLRKLLFVIIVLAVPISASADIDLRTATVQDINRAFEAGTLTSEELVTRYLARIEAYNLQGPTLRAIIVVAPNALERAQGKGGRSHHYREG